MTEKQIIILYLLGHQTLLLFLLQTKGRCERLDYFKACDWSAAISSLVFRLKTHPEMSGAFVGWSGLENDLISIYEYLTALIEHFEALESEFEIVILWLLLWNTTRPP